MSEENYAQFGKDMGQSSVPLIITAFASKPESFKGDCDEKSSQILDILTPVKIKGRIGKSLTSQPSSLTINILSPATWRLPAPPIHA